MVLRSGATAFVVLALSLLTFAQPAGAQAGEIVCRVTENGTPARGTATIEQNGKKVGGGACGAAISVPAGKSTVTVRLDGVLDNPSRKVDVEVTSGNRTPVTVDFATAVLEVQIRTKSAAGTGIVTVNQGGKRIGTLGSGVAARLSAGSYEVIVRLGGNEQRYAVDLRPGQRRLVRAQF